MNQFQQPWQRPPQPGQPPPVFQPDRLVWQPALPELPACPRCQRRRGAAWLVGVLLLLVAGSVGLLFHAPIIAFLATMREMGSGRDPRDKVFGMCAFGIVLVSILAALRIAINQQNRQ